MHKVRVFLNQRASSQSRATPQIEILKKKLFRSSIDFVSPESLDELKIELEKSVAEKVDVVVSVGGDGTVNTLIQILGGSNTAFLVIPAGTANDLAREMGLIKRIDKAIDIIRSGEPEKIDLIKVNDRFMATNGGIGIASHVAETVNMMRDRVPFFKKAMSLFKDRVYSATLALEVLFPRLKYYEIEIETEHLKQSVKTPLLMINNQPALGGSFRIAPETNNNDGSFNVSIFQHTSKLSFLKSIAHIRYKGCPVAGDPDFLSFETKKIRLSTSEPLLFYGDGETFERSSEFQIELLPKALRVYGFRKLHGTETQEIL